MGRKTAQVRKAKRHLASITKSAGNCAPAKQRQEDQKCTFGHPARRLSTRLPAKRLAARSNTGAEGDRGAQERIRQVALIFTHSLQSQRHSTTTKQQHIDPLTCKEACSALKHGRRGRDRGAQERIRQVALEGLHETRGHREALASALEEGLEELEGEEAPAGDYVSLAGGLGLGHGQPEENKRGFQLTFDRKARYRRF